MGVSLFIAGYKDTLFPETGIAVVRVLERLGHAVDSPPRAAVALCSSRR
jgi:L-lactate dehydrogenase complex protein LldE